MAGRPRKPTALKILQGNPGHVKKSKLDLSREPKFSQARTRGSAAPSWLSPEAKKEWKRLLPELKRAGLFSVPDRSVFASYCEAVATLKHTTEVLNRDGYTYRVIKGEMEFENERPEVKMRERAMT